MTQQTISIPLPEAEEEPPEDRNHNPYIVAAILALSIVVLLFYRLSGSQLVPDEQTNMASLQNHAKSNHIFVDVDGAVVRPGVYRLRVGSRVFDAIASAGGLKPQADRLQIKMAAKLHDEDKLIIPAVGQLLPSATPDISGTPRSEVGEEGPSDLPPGVDPGEPPPPVSQPLPELTPPVEISPDAHPSPVAVATIPPPPPIDTKPPNGAASPTPPAPKPVVEVSAASKVSINRATADQFENIPGVGPKLALDIVNYRKGPPPHAFTSLDDLTSVPGLKQAKFDEIQPYLKL